MDDPRGRSCASDVLMYVFIGVIAIIVIATLSGGGDDGSTTNSRTGTLSGNQVELMSRNQLNLWSDVQNCYGDGSCSQVMTTTTSTSSVNTRITGDRNVIIGSDGTPLCVDPATGIYSACDGVQP